MTNTQEGNKNTNRDWSTPFNRIMYVLMVALSFYFLFVKHEIDSAMSNLGIALIFDPFNRNISFSKRPIPQRVLLLAHVSTVFILLGILIFNIYTR